MQTCNSTQPPSPPWQSFELFEGLGAPSIECSDQDRLSLDLFGPSILQGPEALPATFQLTPLPFETVGDMSPSTVDDSFLTAAPFEPLDMSVFSNNITMSPNRNGSRKRDREEIQTSYDHSIEQFIPSSNSQETPRKRVYSTYGLL